MMPESFSPTPDLFQAMSPLIRTLRLLGHTNLFKLPGHRRKHIDILWQVLIMIIFNAALVSNLFLKVAFNWQNDITYIASNFMSLFGTVTFFFNTIVGMVVLCFRGQHLRKVIEIGREIKNRDRTISFVPFQTIFTPFLTPPVNNICRFFLKRTFIGSLTVLLLCLSLLLSYLSFVTPEENYYVHDRSMYVKIFFLVIDLWNWSNIFLLNFLYVIMCLILLMRIRSFNSTVRLLLQSNSDPNFQELLTIHLNISHAASITDNCFCLFNFFNYLNGLTFICGTLNAVLVFTSISKVVILSITFSAVIGPLFSMIFSSFIHSESRASLPNLYRMYSKIPALHTGLYLQLNSVISQVSVPFGMTVGGLFTISRESIASALIAVITYVAVLYQLDLSSRSCNCINN